MVQRIASFILMLVLLAACTKPGSKEVVVGVGNATAVPAQPAVASNPPASAPSVRPSTQDYINSYINTINANEPRVEPESYPVFEPNTSMELRLEETLDLDVMLPVEPGNSGGTLISIEIHWDRHRVDVPDVGPVYVDGYRAIIVRSGIQMLRAFAPFSDTIDEVFPGIYIQGSNVHFYQDGNPQTCEAADFEKIKNHTSVMSVSRHVYPGMGYNGTITLSSDTTEGDITIDVPNVSMVWGEKQGMQQDNTMVWLLTKEDGCGMITLSRTLSGAPMIDYPGYGWHVNTAQSVIWYDPGK